MSTVQCNRMIVRTQHQPDIYMNGGLLNKVCFTLVIKVILKVNPVFSPCTHKCRVGAGKVETTGEYEPPGGKKFLTRWDQGGYKSKMSACFVIIQVIEEGGTQI